MIKPPNRHQWSFNRVIKDPELRERHLGDLQGLVYCEAAKINSEAYQAGVSHRSDQEIPDILLCRELGINTEESELLLLSLMAVSSEHFTGESPHIVHLWGRY